MSLVKEISPNALSAKKMIEKVGLVNSFDVFTDIMDLMIMDLMILVLVGCTILLGMSLLVSFMVARKNRHIDMVEALKDAE